MSFTFPVDTKKVHTAVGVYNIYIYRDIYTHACSQLASACLDGDEDGTAEEEHEEEEAEEEGHEDDEEKSEELLDAEEYDSI